MKRIFTIGLLSFLWNVSYAQKTKTFDVCRAQFFHIYGHVRFEGDTQKDTTYHLIGKDSRYVQLIEYISLRQGSLQDIYNFLTYCNAFLKKEESGIADNYLGNHLSVNQFMGVKILSIYGINGDEKGSTDLAAMQINQIIAGIKYFCKKRNINLE